uniref:Transposase-associated domain-containing protein n=1 Tax=Tanacetum cinerariifolium TaxID=118510 RepID=A0A6L2NSQ8_TANCI|nr:hypothetical protein [Tanacetum cinerariifolium]
MNMDQDRHMLMVDDNVENQFRQNAMQNVGHLVGQNAVQKQGIQNVGNRNGLSVVLEIANQHGNVNVKTTPAEGNGNGIKGNPINYASNCIVKPRKRDVAYHHTQLQITQKDKAWIQLSSEEFDFMAAAGSYDEIKKVTTNCNLQDNLQQASTSGTHSDKAPVYDSDGSAELAKEADESIAKQKALELKIERLLRKAVSQDIMSIVQSNFVVDTSNLQTKLECTKEHFKSCIIKKENEYAKLWNYWYKKCEECKYDKISYDKAYNDMQQKIERVQAQLGDQKDFVEGCGGLWDSLLTYLPLMSARGDRGWMYKRRNSEGRLCSYYQSKVNEFLNFAFSIERVVERKTFGSDVVFRIKCPCSKCKIKVFKKRDEVKFDLWHNGFIRGYTTWYAHGERKCRQAETGECSKPTEEDNVVGCTHIFIIQHFSQICIRILRKNKPQIRLPSNTMKC